MAKQMVRTESVGVRVETAATANQAAPKEVRLVLSTSKRRTQIKPGSVLLTGRLVEGVSVDELAKVIADGGVMVREG